MDWSFLKFEQLNQNYTQGMFGHPNQPPPKFNILPLIWIYLIKKYGTKKVRCVWNGSPSHHGLVTLAHTYDAVLDQAGACIFWVIYALYDYAVFRADVTNVFAEAHLQQFLFKWR